MLVSEDPESALHTELEALRRRVAELETRLVVVPPGSAAGFLSENSFQTQLLNALRAAANISGAAIQRQQAEETLRDSEALYYQMFTGHSAAKLLIEPETGRIVAANPAASQFYGYPLETLQEMNIAQINMLPPEQIAAARQEAWQRRRNYFIFPHRVASGELREVEIYSVPIQARGQTLLYSIIHDITERRQAAEKLRTMADMLDTAPSSVVVHDFQGRLLYANQMTFVLHGYEEDEFMALNLQDLDTPASAILIEERMQLIRDKGRASFEVVHFRKDGTTIPLELFAKQVDWNGVPAMLSIGTDISERKRAEEKIGRLLERLELATRAARQGIWDWDIQKDKLIWDDRMYELYGVKPGEFAGAYETWLAGIHPEDRPISDEVSRRARLGEIEYDTEFRIIRPDGAIRVLKAYGQIVRDGAGNAVRMTGINYDITGQRQAEAALQQRNRELALLNQVIAASAEGRPAEDILDQACRELALVLDVPYVMAGLLDEARATARIVAEYRGGHTPWLLHRVIPVPETLSASFQRDFIGPLVIADAHTDPRLAAIESLFLPETMAMLILPMRVEGQVAGGLVVSTTTPRSFTAAEVDLAWHVTTQVAGALARSHLVQAQRRLIAAVEQTDDSVIIVDKAGTVLYVNPAFERVSGYGRADIIGQDVRILVSGKHEAGFYDDLWTTLGAGHPWRGRVVNRKKDGSCYTDQVTLTPVRDENGTITTYVSVQRDMTRELALEAQLRQAQKMEAVGQLAGGVAHDFNNILTAIFGHASLAQADLPASSPARADLNGVLAAAMRAGHLTRQLLTFARRQVSQPQNLNLNDLVLNMAPMLRRLIGENIELVVLPEPELGWTRVDPHQFEQLLMNLVVNARDAMLAGGKLTIRTANVGAGEIAGTGHGESVLLAVSDTGCGIAPEDHARIFEPFFTTKAVGQGTGLGLATCFGIVEQHKGRITVESEPGRGATFKVYLPRVEAGDEVAEADLMAGGPAGGEETILLVEDDLAVRELARRILSRQGYRVVEAANGAEALRLAEGWGEAPPDLLLTDVVMPLLGGWELAGPLQARWPGLKVLFMSGYTDSDQVQPDRLEQGQAYLAKPFTAASLTAQIRAMLDQP